MRYLAIDFETANSNRSSICAFGYALFENDRLLTAGAELCRPEPNYYDRINTSIHGITFDNTAFLGGFEEHLDKFDSLAPDFLVAHNAAFDMSCLRKWCDRSGSSYPHCLYVCTVQMSRVIHPGYGHKLSDMCDLYGIDLNHHEAGSDALACGILFQRFMADAGVHSMEALCRKLQISPGRLYDNGYDPCGRGAFYAKTPRSQDQ